MLKGLRFIKIGCLCNNSKKIKAAKVKMKRSLKVAIPFPQHKYDFSQLQLFGFVDFEDCHQSLSNTQPFHFKASEFFPFGLHIQEQYTSQLPQGLRARDSTQHSISGNEHLKVFPLLFVFCLGLFTQLEERLKPFTYDCGCTSLLD